MGSIAVTRGELAFEAANDSFEARTPSWIAV
jgi:hypothetical protein